MSHEHADAGIGNYAGVDEQWGIYAGDGGFNINVHGNTDLKGAVIASDADASKNTLNTGTLTFSDIENHSDYSASSSGFSAGASIGAPAKGNHSDYSASSSGFSAGASIGAPAKGTGTSSVGNGGGLTPMLSQSDSGSSDATTRSAISAGSINIADKDHQTQDIANLSRDTVDANGTVSKLPDVKNLLDKQGDMMNAASAAGEAVATQIGAIADAKRDAAKKAAEQAASDGNAELAAQYKAEAASWDEGGSNRIALHIAGGALIGGLGGGGIGSAAQGAAGAGVAAWAAGDLNRLANGTRDALDGGDAAQMAGNVLSNLVAGGMGALIGGPAGAFTASNADLYNRSTGNGHGEGSTANSAFGENKKAGDLVAQVCPGTIQCSPAMLNAAIQAQGDLAQQASGAMSPNYATVGLGSLSGSVGGAVNLYDGTMYASYGVSQSFPAASWAPGGTTTLGWILGARDATSTNSFMNGDGNQFYVSIPLGRMNLMGAITHAYGGSTAIEIGITTPGGITAGVVPWSHSVPLNEKR